MDISELDRLIRMRDSIIGWRSNAQATDSQSRRPYVLRLDIQIGMLAYCGQTHPGSNNYWDAPKDVLAEAVKAEIEARRVEIVTAAVNRRLAELNGKIAEGRATLQALLTDIATPASPAHQPGGL